MHSYALTDFVYDGSFEGLLTAVFEVYDRRAEKARIWPENRYQPDAFAERIAVITDAAKAQRVWKGLQKRVSKERLGDLFSVYLSERPDREALLLAFCQLVFSTQENVGENFSSLLVLQISQIGRQLNREKHRFEAFVRFIHLQDNSYFATIDPDFDVLPLIAAHFIDRYASQIWIIYDTRRHYGIHYNGNFVQEVRFECSPGAPATLDQAQTADDEVYQRLWQVYFSSVNIPARRNLQLHRKHLPIRYWKYLTEKKDQR